MASFTGKRIKNTYTAILKFADNVGITSVLKRITDAAGNNTPMSISTTEVDFDAPVTVDSLIVRGGSSSQFLKADGSVDSEIYNQSFVHTQTTASSSWVITHNLSRYPSVTIVDSGGSVVYGTIDYNSNQQVTITFTASFSGKAYLN